MKKLITLSAIALAGATLGVGTTFGWWADESEEQARKTKTAIVGDVVIQLSPGKFAPEIDGVPVKGKQGDITGGTFVVEADPKEKPQKDIAAGIRFTHKSVDPSALEKLADELEQEAKEFERHDQKEAAAIQRKLSERLRATLKANQSHFKAWQGGGKSDKVRQLLSSENLDKVPNEKIDEHIKQKLGMLKLELKGRDPEQKKNPDAYIQELKARIQEIEANPKKHEEAEAQLKKLKAALEQQDRLASEKDPAPQAKSRDLEKVVVQLRETAEKLEQVGRKDEAHDYREKAEHILRSLKGDHQPKPEKHDIVLDDEPKKVIRFRKGTNDGEGKDSLEIIAVEPKGSGKEKGPVKEHEATGRIIVERLAHVDGAPLFEVQKMLKELHHEIQQLREEVRGLRGLLSDKSAGGKQKVRDDDDKPQADEGKSYKTITKDPKPKVRSTLKRDGDDDKRDGAKKNPDAEKRDGDDDDDEAKSEKRKEKDGDDKKSEDGEEKDDDDSAQAERIFNFSIGIAR